MDLYFWQRALGIHHSALVRSLAELGHRVTMIAETELLPERKDLGWHVPDMGPVTVIVHPHDTQVADLVRGSSALAVHIVSGYRGYRTGRQALNECLARSSRVGLMCEAGDPRGATGIARRLLYGVDQRLWARHVDFVLGMGDLGVKWYRRAGYAHVLPFGYFVEAPLIDKTNACAVGDQVQIVYIGQYISLKGLDLLLRALASLGRTDWTLKMIGDGPSKTELVQLAAELRLAGRVQFLPPLPNNVALKHLMASDLLVLPSWHDGWGAVINEALMCGVPAICSDACGAKDLLSESWRGDVFPAGSVHQLAQLLAQWIARGKSSEVQRASLRAWSASTVEGSVGAAYLLGLLAHVYDHAPAPNAPWRMQAGEDRYAPFPHPSSTPKLSE